MHQISSDHISIDQIENIIATKHKLSLSESAKSAIIKCRKYLDEKIKTHPSPIYGINTGFGSLYNVSITTEDLSQLQYNLILSHACGAGEKVPVEIVQIILFLKIQSLSYGHSGVALETVERLIEMYNHDVFPVIYQQGSLGASGDLAPLAHLCLPMFGLGEVYIEGKVQSGDLLLSKFGWKPLVLQSKEGLALLNGTQFMAGYGVWNIIQSRKLLNHANLIGAMSLDGYDGRIEPFNELIHQVRPHKGQLAISAVMRAHLQDSEIIKREKAHVQDPYSFRCIPQVHGATYDVLRQVEETFTTEINSVTDNPNIFPDEDLILSGGNFHGQILAISADYLAIAMSELGSISERRTYLLISGQRGLPPYLMNDAGIQSGFMIPQYTAASIASQSKQLCTPASADSIVSSNGQEDHVSMGANAATKCYKIIENTKTILAIELLNAAQALDFRKPLKTGNSIEELHQKVRKVVPFIEKDIEMWKAMRDVRELM
jgi:histidine ammonia-lyase